MNQVLEINNLKVVFKGPSRKRETVAIDDLCLNVREGEVVGFIGPNGAGKTTTIKVLMGFIFPTHGTAKVFGYEAGSKNARSRTGYLPEVALYYPFMTASEILRLYGKLHGIRRKELKALVPSLISTVGLDGFERLKLEHFSKGMLQRVGLAQAIMGNPDMLILDEVTAGLDPVGRQDLRNILLDFKHRGKTVFFSSHELSEVAKLCDRILVIDKGKIIHEQSLQNILESSKRYRMKIEANVFLPSIVDEATIKPCGPNIYEIEIESKELQKKLFRELPEHGVRILSMETEEGSLEEYFVNIVGYKIT